MIKCRPAYCALILMMLAIVCNADVLAQAGDQSAPKVDQTVREEIQRYIGYEAIPLRYLTLPFDASMNTNVEGTYVDLTWLIIVFLPIAILYTLRRKWIYFIPTLILTVFWWFVSVSNSKFILPNGIKVSPDDPSLTEYVHSISIGEHLVDYLMGHLYLTVSAWMAPFNTWVTRVAGSTDYVTYPMLTGLSCWLLFIVQSRYKGSSMMSKFVLPLMLVFCYLWLMLAAGIIWYGYMLIALVVLFLFWFYDRFRGKSPVLHIAFWSLTVLLTGTLFVQKMANINYRTDVPNLLIDPAVVKYQSGLIDEATLYDHYYTNVSKAVQEINASEKSKIYRIGTSLPFFISSNNERVLMDNFMGLFNQIIDKYKTRPAINGALKANGFDYLLVGFNVASIDDTPEQTLANKFQKLMFYIKDNPGLELIATDRIVLQNQNGQQVQKFAVFGQPVQSGNFAVYRIKP